MPEIFTSQQLENYEVAQKHTFTIGEQITHLVENDVTTINNIGYYVNKRLPTLIIEDIDGNSIGIMIGFPSDTDRQILPKGKVRCDKKFTFGTVDEFVEENIYKFGGSFLFLLSYQDHKRLYLDACGSFPAVYDPVLKIAGGTTTSILIEEEYKTRFQKDLYDELGVEQDGWFPGTLTAHSGVFRLLPNHYLDLNTWSAKRHWPMEEIPVEHNIDQTLEQLKQQTFAQTNAMAKEGKLAVALTGGADSRFILSANKKISDQLTFVTVSADEDTPSRDVLLAKEITSKFHLDHLLLSRVQSSSQEAWLWQLQTGHCVGGANMHYHPSTYPLKEFNFFIGGLGGEIGAGFFWRNTDALTSEIAAKDIAIRLGMKVNATTLSNIEEWYKTVSSFNSLTILDLAYLELRMASWAFAQSYTNRGAWELHPLISRKIFTAMYSFPENVRRTGMWKKRGIELFWKELLSIPINSQGYLKDTYNTIKRGLLNPALVIRRIRRKLL